MRNANLSESIPKALYIFIMNKKYLYIIHFLFILGVLIPACTHKEEINFNVAIITPKPDQNKVAKGFIQSLANRNYIEGKNITYFYWDEDENLQNFLDKMMEKKVDLIFTLSTPVTKKTKKMTEKSGIPVVFVVNDPVKSGIVEKLLIPGGNLTGVQVTGSTPKTLEWLKSLIHDTKTIWVPVSFDTMAASQSYEDLKSAAKKLDIKIRLLEVKDLDELKAALNSIPPHIDAIFTFHSILINKNYKLIADKAIELKLPLAAAGHEHYKKGALFSYGIGHYEVARHAGRLADSILRGAHPSALPVETADFTLGVNLRTAKKINLHIPDHFIEQANKVIR